MKSRTAAVLMAMILASLTVTAGVLVGIELSRVNRPHEQRKIVNPYQDRR